MVIINKTGILYGIGVGTGDPEDITLKAQRIISETDYIAIPGDIKEETIAYRIIEPVVDNLQDKTYIYCPVKMTKDPVQLNRDYDSAAGKIAEVLNRGENVAFLTIGDPTIYATYMYIHQRVEKLGYKAQIISGIPSFCAAAAALDISLSERSDQLHIIPSSYDIEASLDYPGNKILMKAASHMADVKKLLLERDADVYMVENCGMENQRIFRSAAEIDENAGYLSVVIVKDKHK